MRNEKLEGVRDVIIEKDCAWVIADGLNWLLKYNLLSNELELEAAFPEAIGTERGAFSEIAKVGNEIYFSPLSARDAYYYDLDKKIFQELKFPLDECKDAKNIRMVVQEKDIYFLNRFPDMVIKVDSVTKAIKVFKAENEGYLNQGVEAKIYRGYIRPEEFDDKIFWMSYNNILNAFDMKSGNFSAKELGGLPDSIMKWTQKAFGEGLKDWFIGVRAFQNELWLLSYGGSIYRYNGKVTKVENRLLEDYKCEETNGTVRAVFPDIFVLDNELWFIPQYPKKCIRYHADDENFERALEAYVQGWDVDNREYVGGKVVASGKILLYSYHEGYFHILDTVKEMVHKKEIRVPFGKFARENEIFRQSVIKEKCFSFDDIDFFLEDVGFEMERISSLYTEVGKRIYSTAKK